MVFRIRPFDDLMLDDQRVLLARYVVSEMFDARRPKEIILGLKPLGIRHQDHRVCQTDHWGGTQPIPTYQKRSASFANNARTKRIGDVIPLSHKSGFNALRVVTFAIAWSRFGSRGSFTHSPRQTGGLLAMKASMPSWASRESMLRVITAEA